MKTVLSKDGTQIAYDRFGEGPAVILVDGALGYRAHFGLVDLADHLADRFSAYTYDRRGRGESSDTLPYSVQKEIEDIESLIDVTGEPAFLFGISSGASLAMEAAVALGGKVKKLAMYEAPLNDDDGARQVWLEYTRELGELLRANRRGDAVALFMKLTGATDDQIKGMREMPIFKTFEAVAPTLAYDHIAILGDATVPTARAAQVSMPALVMNGDASYPFMHTSAIALANAMPNGRHLILKGQTHEVAPEVLAPVLVEFFENG